MKKVLYASISVLALGLAVPAAAQTSGTINGGAGIGLGAGGFTNGAIDTGSVNGTNSQTLSIDMNRELSGGSGSGFGGTMNISSLPLGSSYAVVGGVGSSGTSILANVDASNNGSIVSTSFNAGLYGGITGGSAALNMQVMNFGQSSADFKLTSSFDSTHNDSFNATSTDWTMAGAAGVGAFTFGSLGWDVN